MQQVRIADRYLLLHSVGSGGMGRVWLAQDEMLHRAIALKQVVPPNWMTPQERDELRSRTLREARTAARLNHPNVVRIYDVVHSDDCPWIVMEYVPSRSVQQVLDSDGPLSPRRAAEVGLAVLAALRAAHRNGVLHRDVKPHNVLIAEDGRVVLTDFGLATVDGGDGALSRDGVVLGSPQYVSPERAAYGSSTVESDLWSLGATLYAAVEGRSPYRRPTTMATLTALAVAPPDPPKLAGPLRPVLAGLLRRDPRQRLTGDEVERLLRRITDPPPPRSGRYPLALARALARRPPPTPPPDQPAPDKVEPDQRQQSKQRRPPNQRPQPEQRPKPNQRLRPNQSPQPNRRDPPDRPDDTHRPDDPDPAGRPDQERRADPGPPGGPDQAGRPEQRPEPPHRVSGVRRAPQRQPATARSDHPDQPGRPAGPGRLGRRHRWPRPNRRGWWMLAMAVTLTALAGFTTGAALWNQPGDGAPPEVSGSRRPAAQMPLGFPCAPPPEQIVAVTAAPRPPDERFGLIDNWTWYTDPSGFRIAVPIGWQRYTDGAVVCFREPVDGTARTLSVDPSTPASRDAEAYWLAEERRLLGRGALTGYEQVDIGALDIRAGGAVWECRWTNARGDRVHTVRMLINTSARRAYTVSWLTREFDWGVNQSYLRMLQTSFRPAG